MTPPVNLPPMPERWADRIPRCPECESTDTYEHEEPRKLGQQQATVKLYCSKCHTVIREV